MGGQLSDGYSGDPLETVTKFVLACDNGDFLLADGSEMLKVDPSGVYIHCPFFSPSDASAVFRPPPRVIKHIYSRDQLEIPMTRN